MVSGQAPIKPRPRASGRHSPLLRLAPGHSRGTDSRHQADLGGHEGTPRHGNLSSGGHLRTRRDTRGHTTDTVRDREASGSNPGPPTKFESESLPDYPARLPP